MRRHSRRESHCTWLSLVLAAWCLAAPMLAQAADEPGPEIVSLDAGLTGHFKVGYWTPLKLTLRGGAEPARVQVAVIVPDCDGVPTRYSTSTDELISLESNETTSTVLYVKIGQLSAGVNVELHDGERMLAARSFATGQGEALGGILPSDRLLFASVGGALSADDAAALETRGAKVAQVSLDELPEYWWGYDAVDALFLATGDEQIASRLAAGGPQLAALERWVQMGGRLVLSVGRRAERVLDSSSPLARLAPGRFERMVPLRQSSAIEMYVETSEGLSSRGPFELEVPKLADVRGKIESYAGSGARDLPLVVRSAHAFGEVVFLAFDLEQSPMSTWSARMQLIEKLLRLARQRETTSESTLGQVTTLGFVDLAGQLRGALDQFPGVRLVPFWLVTALVLIYIACIGPLDYWFVKKVLRRMEATWVTFAASVIVFCVGAYALGYAAKGRELRANQVDLVDFDAESKTVRGTTWATVYSPAIDVFDLAVRPRSTSTSEAGATRVLFSWLGLPGTGFGGMDNPAAATPLFTEAYSFSPRLDAMSRVPIAIWSSKSFVARWWRVQPAAVEAQLSDQGKLAGTLKSRLEEPLEDCVLLYDRWVYPVRQLRPGQQLDVETQLDPEVQTADTYLRHVTVQGDRSVSAPYDRASFDITRVVEIMGCHELAGGSTYTALANQYQSFVDLSSLIKDGQAVLLGKSRRSATELERDGQPLDAQTQHWTVYRFVFPVAKP